MTQTTTDQLKTLLTNKLVTIFDIAQILHISYSDVLSELKHLEKTNPVKKINIASIYYTIPQEN